MAWNRFTYKVKRLLQIQNLSFFKLNKLCFCVLLSYGDKWQTRRRMITPAFHFEILDDFMHVINEQAEILIEILSQLSKGGKEINIFQRMGLCTLDIICGDYICYIPSLNKKIFEVLYIF